jgi:hypothetical protein
MKSKAYTVTMWIISVVSILLSLGIFIATILNGNGMQIGAGFIQLVLMVWLFLAAGRGNTAALFIVYCLSGWLLLYSGVATTALAIIGQIAREYVDVLRVVGYIFAIYAILMNIMSAFSLEDNFKKEWEYPKVPTYIKWLYWVPIFLTILALVVTYSTVLSGLGNDTNFLISGKLALLDSSSALADLVIGGITLMTMTMVPFWFLSRNNRWPMWIYAFLFGLIYLFSLINSFWSISNNISAVNVFGIFFSMACLTSCVFILIYLFRSTGKVLKNVDAAKTFAETDEGFDINAVEFEDF